MLYYIILYSIMLPIPLIMVITVCGIVVVYMVVESCYVTIQNIKNRMNKKQPPLSVCDEYISNRENNTNDIL